MPHETWGLGVKFFIFFQAHMRRCAFVRGAEGWQKAPWAVQCPFKKMGFGQSPNYPAHFAGAVFLLVVRAAATEAARAGRMRAIMHLVLVGLAVGAPLDMLFRGALQVAWFACSLSETSWGHRTWP